MNWMGGKKLSTHRFNRYMVECEFRFKFLCVWIGHSFNRYMVECECRLIMPKLINHRVLIDTWWNVNLTSTGYVRRDVRSFNRYMVECELIMFILFRFCGYMF